MNELLGYTIVGLATAAIYAIAASGLVVTYATSGVFNIAHGAIGMVMAFVYYELRVGLGAREYRDLTATLEAELAVLADLRAEVSGATARTEELEQGGRERDWDDPPDSGVREPKPTPPAPSDMAAVQSDIFQGLTA